VASFSNILNSYWLWREISSKLNLSNPVYKYWKDTPHIKLNNKYVFIKKNTLPEKYRYIEQELTDLSGYMPVRYAADQLNINSHVFTYEKMRLYSNFEYKYVNDVKFVNIRRFFTEHGIKCSKSSVMHLGKIKDLEITLESRFYNLDGVYGIVIYD
jgi:hypothetical protein